MEDLLYQIAVTLLPKVGPVTARNLISYCGGPRAVFSTSRRELMRIPGIGPHLARTIAERSVLKEAERELRFLERTGARALFYLHPDYPQRLRHLPDAPVLLYSLGNADLNAARTVAVVGTRRPTAQGITLCEEIVEQLSAYNVLLISGLAYGIDGVAHRRALETGTPTLGVLGHGLGHLYPARHRGLAEQMICNGGLLSEYPGGAEPEREYFPMRNRIVAGLCDALIVIETAIKGGSMITAHFANDYHKDVFALPGRIRDKNAQGCNHLIKTHKAHLLESAADLAYIMRWEEPAGKENVQTQLFVELNEAEKLIVNLLNHEEDVSIDKLTFESKLTNSEMAAHLLNLEFKGVVRPLPGKRYILV